MLDFRRHRRASNLPGPALERRMPLLLVAAGVVVLLIVGGGNPRSWRWLLSETPNTAGQHRVQDIPDQVVVAMTDTQSVDARVRDSTVEGDVADGESLFPGVRGDYLSQVRDDTVFRPEESDGWFHLFALLAHTSNQELVEASPGPVTYLQLAQQASAYRGHVVTVHGIVRAAKRVTAPNNAFDVKGYYQLWLQPDRASDELVVLYAVELPKGFPLGDRLEENCAATGIFYKRWAYPSQGGIATAPLVIAKTVDWQPAPPAAEPAPAPPMVEQLLLASVVALILATLVLAFVVRRAWGAPASRGHSDAHDASQADSVTAALASLENQQPRDIESR